MGARTRSQTKSDLSIHKLANEMYPGIPLSGHAVEARCGPGSNCQLSRDMDRRCSLFLCLNFLLILRHSLLLFRNHFQCSVTWLHLKYVKPGGHDLDYIGTNKMVVWVAVHHETTGQWLMKELFCDLYRF